MFSLQDVKDLQVEGIINYINQKNKKVKKRGQLQDSQKTSLNNEQNQMNMKSLILSLKNNTIDYLKNEFLLSDNKITVQKFVYLMKECISYQKEKEYQICYQLIKLFEQIDIDASNSMDWSQFLQYLTGYGWLGETNQRRDKNQKEQFLIWNCKQKNNYRKNNILKIVQIERLNIICVLQAANFSLSFIGLDDSQIIQQHKIQISTQQKQKPQLFTLSSVNLKKVLSIDYCQQQRLFGVLMTDKSLIFIQDGEMQKVVANILGNGQQSQIIYLFIHKIWLIRSINGLIQIIQSPKQSKLRERVTFSPHQQPLTSIKQLKNPLCLCTSSLDGTIKLWSINYKQLLISLNLMNEQQTFQKMKGIKGIDTLNLNSNSYIASWTFSTDIGIWLPSSSVSKPYIGKLKGHIGIIQNCQFSNHKQYLLSIDNKKSIRLWNVQKMSCLQMLAAQTDAINIKCLKSYPCALIYSKIIDFYKIKTNTKLDNLSQAKNKSMQQTRKLISVSFCPYYIFLLLLFNTQLKVFDVNSGKLVTIIYPTNRQQQQFNAVTLKINRRVFLSSTHGNIYYNHLDTGTLIKKFKIQNIQDSHKYVGLQIKFLYFHADSKILLVVAQENHVSIILTYRQLIGYQFQLTKVLQFQSVNLKKINYMKKLQILTISSDKMISLWDFEKMNIINSISCYPYGQQIKDSIIIQEYNLIIVLIQTKIILYQIQKQGYIKSIELINLPQKFVNIGISKFNIQISNNENLQKTVKQRKTRKNISKEKSVKFIIDQEDKNHNNQLLKQQQNNQKVVIKNKLKSTQKILINKYSKSKLIFILYLCSDEGNIFAYQISNFIIRREKKQSLDVKPSKFAGHSIRQFRKCSIKFLKNYNQPIEIQDFQECFLFEKQVINEKIKQIGSIYREIFYITSEKGNVMILKCTGQIVGSWLVAQNEFTHWNLHFNMLPKILQRLNKLQLILNMSLKKYSLEQIQMHKAKFLANLYLDQMDLAEIKQYVKIPTSKSINPSSKNLLFKKNLKGSSKQIKSLKKIQEQKEDIHVQQFQWNSIKKKTRIMSHKMKINQKRKNQQTKKQNFFNQKYDSKKEQNQKMKIHRKYIQKRIEKTLSYAKNLQKLNKEKPQNQIQMNKKQIQQGVVFINKLQQTLNQIPLQKDMMLKSSFFNVEVGMKKDFNRLQKQRQSSLVKLTNNFIQKKEYLKNQKKQIEVKQVKRAQSSHNFNPNNQKQASMNSLKSLYKIQSIGVKDFIKKQFLPHFIKEKQFSSILHNQRRKNNKLQL